MTETADTKGNASIEVPITERYNFASSSDVEKYEQMLADDRNYVRVDKDGKPDRKHKDYFWKIVSLHPTVPQGVFGTSTFIVTFGLQKFSRKQFETIDAGGGRKSKKYLAVRQYGETGELLDEDASPHYSASKFLAEFRPEAAEM
jgi:hypothetical protein